MKITKNLRNESSKPEDSLFKNKGKTTKHTIRLNVGRTEKELLRRLYEQAPHPRPKRVRREPLERMFKIHRVIAAGHFPNAAALAFDLAVGHKTICRDIEYMRDYYMFPIEYSAAERGYFYSKPVDGFPGAPSLTEDEISALFVAYKAVEQYRGTPFHQPLRIAFQKLSGQLDSKERYSLEDFGRAVSFRPFAPEDADLRLFKIVARALRDRHVLEFAYRKPGEKESSLRRVHPYHLMCRDNRWYLFALDESRDNVRTFALSRMENLAASQDRFTPPRNFDPIKYLHGSLTVMKGEGDYDVVIEFDAFATDQLRGRQWHSSQEITELPGGGSRLRMRLSGLEEVERWVLSWGTRATVTSPTALIERISATATQLLSRYTASAHAPLN